MWFKHRAWIPVAWLLAVGNVLGALVAMRMVPTGSWHAATHLALAAGFALGARQLMTRRREGTLDDQLQQTLDQNEQLQQTLDSLQQRVYELEERVDFSERLLATQRDADRLDASPRDPRP
jgi:uncharacterized protein YlxW (UPF0749 family)